MSQSLDDLLDAARADAAAVERARARWLAQQAEESATFVGTLLDLAEHGGTVALECAGGRRVIGTIAALGTDVAVVAERNGDRVVVALGHVALVRADTSDGAARPAATGARTAALDLTHAEVLARVAGERPDVALSLATGATVAGVLLGVGADVVSVRLADAGGTVYVSLSSVACTRLG